MNTSIIKITKKQHENAENAEKAIKSMISSALIIFHGEKPYWVAVGHLDSNFQWQLKVFYTEILFLGSSRHSMFASTIAQL